MPQVLVRSAGIPKIETQVDEKGVKVQQSDEVRQFTALAAKYGAEPYRR